MISAKRNHLADGRRIGGLGSMVEKGAAPRAEVSSWRRVQQPRQLLQINRITTTATTMEQMSGSSPRSMQKSSSTDCSIASKCVSGLRADSERWDARSATPTEVPEASSLVLRDEQSPSPPVGVTSKGDDNGTKVSSSLPSDTASAHKAKLANAYECFWQANSDSSEQTGSALKATSRRRRKRRREEEEKQGARQRSSCGQQRPLFLPHCSSRTRMSAPIWPASYIYSALAVVTIVALVHTTPGE